MALAVNTARIEKLQEVADALEEQIIAGAGRGSIVVDGRTVAWQNLPMLRKEQGRVLNQIAFLKNPRQSIRIV